MKNKIKLLALLIMSVILLSGCNNQNNVVNSQKTQGEITTITFFGNKYEPENVTVIEDIISGFMKDNPNIRVSYESLKGSDYYEALEKRMANGKGDDIFMVNHDVALSLESKGQLADLSDLSTISDFTDQMLNQMKDNGNVYWVPTTVSAFGLYCNNTLLKKYNQKRPENLNEWKQTCDFFINLGITPIIANNDISIKTLAIGKGFYSVYQENRQNEVFSSLNNGKESLSSYLQSGFSIAETFIQNGYINAEKALETNKTSDDLQEFIKGESPFMLTGAWAANRVDGMNPDFEFDVLPIPVLDNDSLVVINADTRLSINADSKHLTEAAKFVEYFTKAENIQRFADQQSSFSPLKNGSPSTVKEIQSLIPYYMSGKTVIGTDTLLNIPIWDLTSQASKKLLSHEELSSVMNWMDENALSERNIQ